MSTINFVDAREYGVLKNNHLKNNPSDNSERADSVLHGRGIYKDIRSPQEIKDGVTPESKYPELAKAKKTDAAPAEKPAKEAKKTK